MSSNEELNKLSLWIDKKCIHCNRGYPQTILNIEGVIHHKEKARCLDTKECKKHKKKRSDRA